MRHSEQEEDSRQEEWQLMACSELVVVVVVVVGRVNDGGVCHVCDILLYSVMF